MNKENIIFIFIFPLSTLIPVLSLLIFNHEFLFSKASVILYLIILALSILPMLIINKYFSKYKFIILSIIVFLFIYVMYFPNQAPKLSVFKLDSILTALLIFSFLLIFFYLLKKRITNIVFTLFFIILVLTILIPDRSSKEIKTYFYETNLKEDLNNKRYIHIILDQHVGLDGIKENTKKSKNFKKKLSSKYLNFGFDIYPKAYVQFFQTKLSVPSILNFSSSNEIFIENYESEPPYIILKQNKLFEYLSNKNYIINAYGNYLGWCDPKYSMKKCVTYRRTILFNQSESVSNKVLLVLDNLLSRYRLIQIYNYITPIKFNNKIIIPSYNWNPPVVDAHTTAALETFDILSEDILNSKTGEAFFAHIFFPHSPYLYNENCELKFLEGFRKNNPSYALYFEQLMCCQKKIIELIQMMKERKILESSVIVIHGDHGPFYLEDDDLDKRNWRKYSTFFAIYDGSPVNKKNNKIHNNYFTVSSLLKSFFENNFQIKENTKSVKHQKNNTVYIFDPKKLIVREDILENFKKGNTQN